MRRLAPKATRKHTRIHNKRLVLKTIYDQAPISRADIARATQLTRATVSDVVAELMGEGLVEEIGLGPSAGGKPPTLLSIVDDSRHLIGVDLASGEFRGVVVNLQGKIRHHTTLHLHGQDGDVALALVYELIDDLIAATDSPLLGIGIGAPGLMDTANGIVRRAVNMEWHNLPMRSLLQDRYGLPVYVANDCQMAALAEYTFGDNGDTENLITVKSEHGVGAGIVINGRLLHGDTFGAGEVGHTRVVEDGLPCRCGNFGCLETVASGVAVVERAQAIARKDADSPLHRFADSPEEITIEAVCQALEAGDEAVRQLTQEVGHYLGIAVANMIGLFGIRRVVIAGNVTCLGQVLLDAIKQDIATRCLKAVAEEVELRTSSMGRHIVAVGASASVLIRELGLFAPF